MSKLVAAGATLSCTMGTAPSTLSVLPGRQVLSEQQAVATVQDCQPNVNVAPFGLCQSPSNPQVAAATAAAMGVLTPQPCLPVIPAPWTPGSPTVVVQQQAALTADSRCSCQWGGVITINAPGQQSTEVG